MSKKIFAMKIASNLTESRDFKVTEFSGLIGLIGLERPILVLYDLLWYCMALHYLIFYGLLWQNIDLIGVVVFSRGHIYKFI